MPETPRPERKTQDRVVKLFTDTLGYRYLDKWDQREDNSAIEEDLLRANLGARGYSDRQINAAVRQLEIAADSSNAKLYEFNMRTYRLLRYGAKVQTEIGKAHETVHFVDWDNAEKNDFALAEEVTLKGEGYQRRPDIVLYLNGLAVAVMELKRGSVEVADGVRQLITNQEEIFNKGFFSTAQLLLAGNDSQGLRYGTTGTPEQFFAQWKDEDTPGEDEEEGARLDRPLAQMCGKERLLDLIRNFVIFDGGRKKIPRPHQFLGVKAAQERIRKREGGVIWHTQGSGKSIMMVLIARWLLEYDPDARILIVTDRDELDKQIESVMKKTGVVGEDAPSPRVNSRAEFAEKLGMATSRLMCALIHKFVTDGIGDEPPVTAGNFYVFVDECHRTQGGDMHKQMKRWLEGAIFVGFTGTPLLKKDKPLTRDIFGTYIDTYKFKDGVRDGVILDLKYEARDVPQRITSQDGIDKWFAHATRNLNNFQKAVVRRNWATMQELMSAEERKRRIIASIIDDFALKPRLNEHRGTAILVAASIYDACHYFRLFKSIPFGAHCGIVTSYQPNHNDISREPRDSDERYKFDTYTEHVLADGQSTKQYEDEAKRLFIEEPANMKLLIVVNKLLTGFDAPSCTYIYLDNELHDHNLFQAICRTNRLDGDDKTYGHIVDFNKLIGEVREVVKVYNDDDLDLDDGGGEVSLKDWLKESKKKLDDARESLHYVCEPVQQPRKTEQFLQYFCGDANDAGALKQTEEKRVTFYKAVAAFVRAFAHIAQDIDKVGYSKAEAELIRREADAYGEIRNAVKTFSGETLDIKPFEADMRHLLNTYVQADPAVSLGGLNQVPLTEFIVMVDTGGDAVRETAEKYKLPDNKAVAEAVINNIRKTIIRYELADPRFYRKMSKLLADLIAQSRESAEEYKEFMRKAQELMKQLAGEQSEADIPAPLLGNKEAAVIHNNLPEKYRGDERVKLALDIDRAMRENAPANWREHAPSKRAVKRLLLPLLGGDQGATLALFDIITRQPGY